MTTKDSPLRELKRQADYIAMTIKKFERGEQIDVKFAYAIEKARQESVFKFAIIMDDKTIILEVPWDIIATNGEVALSEFIIREMREQRVKH